MAEQKLVQKRVRFRYREQTPDGVLLKYLSNHPTKKIEELLWEAARMSFMPMAYVHAGVADERVLRKVALSSFSDFVRQWDCIQMELNFELALPTSLMSIESVGKQKSASATVVQQEVVERVNTKKTGGDNQVTVAVIEESDQNDDFWDDDQDVKIELSDEQKAVREEMDALFG
ncbi:MAG: hypothetical protein KME52_19295 [Desmonostoc geniculatum HA4340-LM1]|jgi:hypothetical protein|nr:hypothetical protein [Desmonostoc geniculatum HA4340-LM1]